MPAPTPAVAAPSIEETVTRLRRREAGALARALTAVERRAPGVDDLLARLHPDTGRAHVLGVTGPAGSGKSTLVTRLTQQYRARGRTVAVLAVDPSSTYSGGAILGDRIRMSDLSGDAGVYIRSLATRGAMGGLSRAVLDGITVLDAAGFDAVVLETVGVGQAEVDVISVAHTVLVVSVPGLGDDVQAIKAGLLEIADVHVVNKADRPGADQTYAELRDMLRLSHRRPRQWNVPIVRTTSTRGEGVAELADECDTHLAWLDEHGGRAERERRNAATRVRWAAEELVLDRLRPGHGAFDAHVDAVVARTIDPRAAAAELVHHL
ncbi:LAO/AO transport system kinase [Jatrophihabitans endophyticus]|uniref:LAO/AO transport system kinase n=1 Tax=Jatrophihabitans endophyticus TaxID=1206085 RepID=A0A1M5Q2J3_9ACTN|nr:methylmalonyl Co-A mutase-associated GTPase MeaB [Jatrophihabitans endophyticus]SHH08258.1 LAO/AO transport system kinase [Jatrophihabitans endophyticus]